ncbi:hypothetical protein TWF281_010782 [Arthrobotrys megalospora]
MAATTGMLVPQSTNIQLSEDEERASLEKLVQLRDVVRSGQHLNHRPKPSDGPGANNIKNGQPVASNTKQNGTAPPALPTPTNTIDTAARPIPVFTGSSKGEQNGGRAVITVAGKDAAPHQNNGRDQRDVGRQQQGQRMPQQQQQLPLNQPQWDHNQPWMMPPGQNQIQANPEDMNAFAQHLSMLAVPPPPPPPFELPPGFPLLPVPHLLPGQALPGQPLPQLIPLTNQTQPQPEPMVVDKPAVVDARNPEKKEREQAVNSKQQQQQQQAARQNANNQTSQPPAISSATTDLQAGLKKAQEYAATLPPKPAPGTKQNAQNVVKQQQQDKNRNNSGQSTSPMAPAFPANADRRDDEKPGFQGRPQRDHRQYGDKRGAEPLRKTAMNNNHNTTKEERRERERDRHLERERERGGDRWQGREGRGFDSKKRRSTSPIYDELPSNKGSGFAAPPSTRPAETIGPSRVHDHKLTELDEGDEATTDPKKRANPKDIQKQPLTAEKRSSPPQQQPQPVKREAPPLSPVVTIPRGSPTLEPLSPGRAARYGIPPPDRYAKQQPGYFRYRDPYPPPPHVVGYARSPYEAEYSYPPPRDPRPMSPRRMYLPEGRGYAQEYVYQDAYNDPYYPYPARRPGSPPPRTARPQYRYEDEELQRAPRGRSPSPRAAGRMPAVRPRRSSRSLSPSRERPTPRASAAPAEVTEEPRPDRAIIRVSDAPHYADYPPYHRPMVPYDAYGDPYNRPVIIRERVPVYVTRVVYVDSNDPEGRPYRPRSPGYAAPHAPPTQAHPHAPPPHPPPPMRRYVDDPDVMMSDRVYRERDYDYGPYDRGYGREYAREYAPPPLASSAHHHHPPPPPQQMRDGYAREYGMAPPPAREEERERVYREREYGVGNPPMGAPRDVEDGRLPYGRDRGMAPGAPGGVRYA